MYCAELCVQPRCLRQKKPGLKWRHSAVRGRWVRSGVMWFPDRLRATLWRCQSMVWIASWLVPRSERASWRSEQNRKFWHWCHFLSESGQLTAHNRLIIARHCWATVSRRILAAIRSRTVSIARSRGFLGSPLTFLLALALVVSALVLGSGIIPAARTAFSSPVPHPIADRLHHSRRQRDQRQVQPDPLRHAARPGFDLEQIETGGRTDAVFLGARQSPAAEARPAGGNGPRRSRVLRDARCEGRSGPQLCA